MRKQFFIAVAITTFLLVPISVYAYSNNIIPTTNSTTTETTTVEVSNYFNSLMGNYNYMSEMMNGSNMEVCTDLEQHSQFMLEQLLEIEQQSQNDEITQEEAYTLLNELAQMLQIHEQHHSENQTFSMNCH